MAPKKRHKTTPSSKDVRVAKAALFGGTSNADEGGSSASVVAALAGAGGGAPDVAPTPASHSAVVKDDGAKDGGDHTRSPGFHSAAASDGTQVPDTAEDEEHTQEDDDGAVCDDATMGVGSEALAQRVAGADDGDVQGVLESAQRTVQVASCDGLVGGLDDGAISGDSGVIRDHTATQGTVQVASCGGDDTAISGDSSVMRDQAVEPDLDNTGPVDTGGAAPIVHHSDVGALACIPDGEGGVTPVADFRRIGEVWSSAAAHVEFEAFGGPEPIDSRMGALLDEYDDVHGGGGSSQPCTDVAVYHRPSSLGCVPRADVLAAHDNVPPPESSLVCVPLTEMVGAQLGGGMSDEIMFAGFSALPPSGRDDTDGASQVGA
jgi:hypothetical protein